MSILAECPICHKKQKVSNKICHCGANLDKIKKNNTNPKAKAKVMYWISYRLPGGKQRREAVGFSIEEARDANAKRRTQKRENRIFDIKPEAKMSFNELTKWYLKLEKVKALARYPILKINLNTFNSVFGNTIVNKLKPTDLEDYQAKRKAEGLADSYVDQQISMARAMINKAFDNDLVSGDTIKVFKRVEKLLKGDANARDRVLSGEEFNKLMAALPSRTRAIVATAYYAGMRKGEVVNLTWDKVDMKKRVIWLEAADTKDKEKRSIPICDALHEILNGIPRAIHDNHIFLFKGKPIKDIRTSLRRACRDADIPYGRRTKDGFVFHDTRHSFVTNARKSGVQESVIMNITGHSTRAMFDRYNKIDDADKKKAIDQMESHLKSVDQNVDQAPENAKEG